MKPSLYDLFRQCTVRISVPGKPGYGTGFFVAPGLILTCAHVINTLPGSDLVEVLWDNQPYSAQVKQSLDEPDVALLISSLLEHPYVCLRGEVEPFDKLYSYGYTDTYPQGEPASFLLEGATGQEEKHLKLKTGQVRPGLSGAPLLNIQTGCVCGIIQKSRDRESDLGGRAISIDAVLAALPELEQYQQGNDTLQERWRQLRKTPSASPFSNVEQKNAPHPHQNLLRLFHRVYNQQYAQSLQKIPEISLQLHERFQVTHSSAQRVFRRTPSVEESPFPPGTSIVDAYDHMCNGILLLGEPGAGKTTLLLELAMTLLMRASDDPTHPIPVILNLSSWAKKQQPLDEWIIDELTLAYGISPLLGKRYIEHDQLLLLLDELDAVAFNEPRDDARKVRSACVQAINTYHQSHFVPLVVCSRSQDYLDLEERLLLPGAVVVQPLQKQEVTEYLERQGKPVEALSNALSANPILQSLIATPFMLSVVLQTYKDHIEDLPRHGSIEQQQRQILKQYIQRVLEQQPEAAFSPRKIVHFLTFLARQMRQHQQTVFYLEQLQADWLPSERKQNSFFVWSAMFLLTFMQLFPLLICFFATFLDPRLTGTVSVELVGGIALYGLMMSKINPAWSRNQDSAIQPVDRLAWSWKKSYVGLSWIMGGTAVGLSLPMSWLAHIGAGLIAGFVGTLVNGFAGTSVEERERIKPNQGIDNSGEKCLLISALTLPGIILFNWVIGGQSIDLLVGFLVGLPISLTVGIYYSGFSYARHYLLRFFLWRMGKIPWHFVFFLDQCTNAMLLQRRGAGYSFIHPLFLDYFATFSPESILSPIQPITQDSHTSRTHLLDCMRTVWIEPLLERPSHESGRIAPDLQKSVDVPKNSQHSAIQGTRTAQQPLPAGTTIEQVYDEAEGGLLILGEAGSGKTTLLLELARALVARAEQDETAPLPALFHLQNWAQKQKQNWEHSSLDIWLIEELKNKYGIPQVVAEAWLGEGKLVPLLDNLDQVSKEAQAECIEAINKYYQRPLEGKQIALVVCSRSKDYLYMPAHLRLRQSVSIQPLNAKQIEQYFQNAGKQLKKLRQTLREDQELRKLVRCPLILSVFTQVFQEIAAKDIFKNKSSKELTQYAFAAYVDRMLTHRGPQRTGISKEDFIRFLRLIAGRMQRRKQTRIDSYLSNSVNITWLEGHREHLLYRLFLALYYVLASGPIFLLWLGRDLGFLCTLASAAGGLLGWPVGVIIGAGFIMQRGLIPLLIYILVQLLVLFLGIWMSTFAIRLALWSWHRFPLKLAPFLDDAEDCLLVRKEGTEYMFIHRSLQNYLASLDGPRSLKDIYTVSLSPLMQIMVDHLQRQYRESNK